MFPHLGTYRAALVASLRGRCWNGGCALFAWADPGGAGGHDRRVAPNRTLAGTTRQPHTLTDAIMNDIGPTARFGFVTSPLVLGSFWVALLAHFYRLVGDAKCPRGLCDTCAYTAVGDFLPALVGAASDRPAATDGQLDLPRYGSAAAALTVGRCSPKKNVACSRLFSGAATLFIGLLCVTGLEAKPVRNQITSPSSVS